MRKNGQQHSIAGVFVFLLLGVFAVMSMMLVLESAQAYRSVVNATNNHNQERIVRAYVRNALSAEDCAQAVRLEEQNGIQVLAIGAPPEDGTEGYIKYIYCHDGKLWDQYASTNYAFRPDYGEEICAMQQLDMALEGQLLRLTMVDEAGQAYSESIALRSEQGEVSAK